MPPFVPAVVERRLFRCRAEPRLLAGGSEARRRRHSGRAAAIELEIDGVTVRVGRGADARTIAAVIRALKAAT